MNRTPLPRSGQASFVCPIAESAEVITRLGKDITRLIRQIRRNMAACTACPCGGSCEQLQQFYSQIHEAVLEINEEWDLSV